MLKVGNQVWQLRHLDVTLDHITGVKVSDGLDELLESIVILLLLIQVVCMLLRYFCDDFPREICGSGNILSLREETLLQECLYLNIIFHLVELEELLLHDASLAWLRGEHIDGIFLHLHEEDLWERLAVDGEAVLEVVD